MMIFIDLFCGAGGVTTGIERARHKNNKLAKVIACVNHDPLAIKSHAYNHKKVLHFVEDIRALDLTQLIKLVAHYRAKYPNAAFAIWASLECTNFSKAKGGKPREADSRTLGEHLDRYIAALNPDYVFIENVVEFMSWGPLDENGKPISKFEGLDYIKWKQNIESMGYRYDHRILNAADYGAYTRRERYFAQFAKGDAPIHWPEATHTKKTKKNVFQRQLYANMNLKPWKAVKDVLDFSDEGNSIFGRKKDYSTNTLFRVYAGLIKHIAGGRDNFLAKTYAVASNSDGTYNTESTAHVITTRDSHNLIQVERGENAFITKYYSNGGELSSIHEPSGALTTKDRMTLVQVKKAHYLLNPQWMSKTAQSVDDPCFTLIARMDKAPPSVVTTEPGQYGVIIYDTDSEIVVKIKEFMILYGIIDIKMRMLKVNELLRIQGFPKGYYLAGSQADQKKFIGNSVCPPMAEAIIKTSSLSFIEHQSFKVAA